MKHGGVSSYKRCLPHPCDECTDARRAYMKAYREKNRQRLNEADRARYAARSEEASRKAKEFHERFPERRRQNRLWAWYRLTPEAYASLLETQGHRCAICRTDTPSAGKNWAVDHDHSCCPDKKSCGKCVRGLLCGTCNTGIGMLGDDASRVLAAYEYLVAVTLRKL